MSTSIEGGPSRNGLFGYRTEKCFIIILDLESQNKLFHSKNDSERVIL